MPTPKQLVQFVSNLIGIPENTLTAYDRNLSIAGLRSKHGRGWAAAKVSSRDAAHLLIAACAVSVRGTNSADIVRSHMGLLAREHTGNMLDPTIRLYPYQEFLRTAGLLSFANLPENHNFVDALAALIEDVQCGRLGLRELTPEFQVSYDTTILNRNVFALSAGQKTLGITINLTAPPDKGEIIFRDFTPCSEGEKIAPVMGDWAWVSYAHPTKPPSIHNHDTAPFKRTNELGLSLIVEIGQFLNSHEFGINIHRASPNKGEKSVIVEKWSAGCQVIDD